MFTRLHLPTWLTRHTPTTSNDPTSATAATSATSAAETAVEAATGHQPGPQPHDQGLDAADRADYLTAAGDDHHAAADHQGVSDDFDRGGTTDPFTGRPLPAHWDAAERREWLALEYDDWSEQLSVREIEDAYERGDGEDMTWTEYSTWRDAQDRAARELDWIRGHAPTQTADMDDEQALAYAAQVLDAQRHAAAEHYAREPLPPWLSDWAHAHDDCGL